jgi:PAS domain-containing protein
MSMDILKATILNCLEKKDLKEQIKQAEERYSQLIQNLPIVIFALRRDFSIDFINQASQAILGFKARELMENRGLFFRRIPKEDRKEIARSFKTCFRESNTPFSWSSDSDTIRDISFISRPGPSFSRARVTPTGTRASRGCSWMSRNTIFSKRSWCSVKN